MTVMRDRTTKELAKRIDPTYIRHEPRSWAPIIIGAILFLAAGIGWWYTGRTDGMCAVVNPGHVSLAHAKFQNDCAQCHDNDGKGFFRAAVSESACVKCHDPAAHAPTPLLGFHSRAHRDAAVLVTGSKGEMRSADCMVCHTEHKGDDAMAVKTDSQCTACHRDVDVALEGRRPRTVTQTVMAFDGKGSHPYFGREVLFAGHSLPAATTTFDPDILHDPTILSFNHKMHISGQGKVDPLPGQSLNCTVCHVTQGHRATTRPSDIHESSDLTDGRYMQPINFDRNCKVCHLLKVSGGAQLPHVAMDLILEQISNPANFFKNWLDHLDPAKRKAALEDGTPDKWVADTVTAFGSDVSEWAGNLAKADGKMAGAEALENVIVDLAANTPDKVGTDLRVITAYVAFGANKGCAKCHEVKSLFTPTTTAPSATTTFAEAGKSATQSTSPLLATVLTGIPQTPRRWFRYSMFDHQAHFDTSCVHCHERANTSTETCDVLSPNLNWKMASGELASCADCHRPKDAKGGGAGTNCAECHLFHEPSTLKATMARTNLPQATPAPEKHPATQPVALNQN